jgi:Tol biopolymer transport system component
LAIAKSSRRSARGALGEVYRARDPRLGREVALKVSAVQFSDRFEREARVVASLNHPNICTLFDVGPNFLVMELVEGPTLAERIQEGPIPVDEALEIARQIADALDAAHEKGIVHRDLKPANVKLKPDGGVKVLDFGLAKTSGTTAPHENSPTITIGGTEAGVILGTAAYMAPEQARGKPVDKRSDIWAFGVVLYEMLTGQRLFQGETMTDLLAAVVTAEPDLERVPTKVRKLLRRCLEKDQKKRLRDIGDAMSLVEENTALNEPRPRRNGWIPWTAAGAPVLALAGLAFVHFREKSPALPEPVRFQIESPKLAVGNSFYMPLSPDGRKLAYTAVGADGTNRLWIRDMDTLESRMLAGTEGAVSPFWSPDSRYLAFGVGNTLKKVDASAASPPQALCQAPGAVGSGSWNADGVIVFGGRGAGSLQRCSASGGTTAAVTALSHGESFHTFPVFLPDGHHFVYLRAGSAQGIYVGSLDVKPAEQSTKPIMESQLGVAFASSANPSGGRLLFLRDNTLMAQPFNIRRLELEGEPVPIAERVAQAGSAGWFSVSSTGALAYRTGGAANVLQLTWYDRKGNVISRVGEPRAGYTSLDLSPDGTRLAHVQQQDVWIMDLTRGIDTRLTFHPALTRYGIAPAYVPRSPGDCFLGRHARSEALLACSSSRRAGEAGGDYSRVELGSCAKEIERLGLVRQDRIALAADQCSLAVIRVKS